MAPTTRGWIVTLAAFLTNLALGAAFVLSAAPGGVPRQAPPSLTWSLCATAVGFALVMPFAGALQDRYGPRPIATLGAVLVSFGLLTGIEVSPVQMFATWPSVATVGFGMITGSGIAFGYAAATPAAVKWFAPHQRGLVCGIVVSGFALAGLGDLGSLAWIAPRVSSTGAHIGLSVAFLLGLAGLARLISEPPSGLVPPYAYEAAPLATGPITPPPSHTWREAARTPAFALMWLTLAIGAGASIGALALGLRIATGSGTVAAGPVSLVAAVLGNIVGRPLSGLLADLVGRRVTIAGAMAVLTIALFSLAVWGASAAGAAGVAIGAAYGGLLAVFPALTFDLFGTRHGGADYGVLFTAWGVGGVLGALSFSALVTAVGLATTAPAAFGAASAVCALGVALALRTQPPRRVPAASASASEAAVRT